MCINSFTIKPTLYVLHHLIFAVLSVRYCSYHHITDEETKILRVETVFPKSIWRQYYDNPKHTDEKIEEQEVQQTVQQSSVGGAVRFFR